MHRLIGRTCGNSPSMIVTSFFPWRFLTAIPIFFGAPLPMISSDFPPSLMTTLCQACKLSINRRMTSERGMKSSCSPFLSKADASSSSSVIYAWSFSLMSDSEAIYSCRAFRSSKGRTRSSLLRVVQFVHIHNNSARRRQNAVASDIPKSKLLTES